MQTGEKAGSLTEEARLPRGGSDDDAKQKKKSDDLWASFLSDVGSRPKDASPAAPSGTKQEVNTSELHLSLKDVQVQLKGSSSLLVTIYSLIRSAY